MNYCTEKGCQSIVSDLYTEQGWIRVCPVCGSVHALPDFSRAPDAADMLAANAYIKAGEDCMDYAAAERGFLSAFRMSRDEELRAGYLWWAVLCHYGIRYVSRELYKNDAQRQRREFIPILNRFPLPDEAPGQSETLRLFQRFLESHPSKNLFSLFSEAEGLYRETLSSLQDSNNHYDVFLAWHDRAGSTVCQDFAYSLINWISSHQRNVYCFSSFLSLADKEVWHFESSIYTALATARVYVIVTDDYSSLGDGFLKWEIKRMEARKKQDDKVSILFNGMRGHTGTVPDFMAGWERHYEDSTDSRDRIALVGRSVLDRLANASRAVAEHAQASTVDQDKHADFGTSEVRRKPADTADPAQSGMTAGAQSSAKAAPSVFPGSILTFGRWAQDALAPEPLRWRVLEVRDGAMLLLAERAVEVLPYHKTNDLVSWESSSLRRWLNGVFLSQAFSERERASMVRAVLPDLDYHLPSERPEPHADTVFLLSAAELKQYLPHRRDRLSQTTKHLRESGAYLADDGGACRWWLRSPRSFGITAQYVDVDGRIDMDGVGITRTTLCVRPAVLTAVAGSSLPRAGAAITEKAETKWG